MDESIEQNGLLPIEEAAVILLSMGEESAAAVLRCLGREELLEVTQVMSRMGKIKIDIVKRTIQKFFDEYRQQSGLQGASRSFLEHSLDLALGNEVAGSVLNTLYGDTLRPKMAKLQWLQPKWLATCIVNEHVQMQAIFLSMLPPALSGEVITALPESMRDLVLLQIARLTEIDHELVIELEEIIDRCLDHSSMQGVSIKGLRQAADIINRLPGDRARMIELLRVQDPAVVQQIETSMYDFFILSRQTEIVLARIVESVPLECLAMALKGAESAVCHAIIAVMPRRQAQVFQTMMHRLGPVAIRRVEAARREIMEQVKMLEESGQIELQRFAERVIE